MGVTILAILPVIGGALWNRGRVTIGVARRPTIGHFVARARGDRVAHPMLETGP